MSFLFHYKGTVEDFISYFKDKRNLINLLLLAVLVAAMPLGIRLVQQQNIFKSRATGADVQFLTEAQGGTDCVVQQGGSLQAICSPVKLRITGPNWNSRTAFSVVKKVYALDGPGWYCDAQDNNNSYFYVDAEGNDGDVTSCGSGEKCQYQNPPPGERDEFGNPYVSDAHCVKDESNVSCLAGQTEVSNLDPTGLGDYIAESTLYAGQGSNILHPFTNADRTANKQCGYKYMVVPEGPLDNGHYCVARYNFGAWDDQVACKNQATGTVPTVAPTHAPTSAPTPVGGSSTICGRTRTWAQFDQELQNVGYNGPYDHGTQETAAYKNAACPASTQAPTSAPTSPPVVTTTHYRVTEQGHLDEAAWLEFRPDVHNQMDVDWDIPSPTEMDVDKFVEVEFKASDESTQVVRAHIRFNGPNPAVTGCTPTLDPNGGVIFDIVGTDFGIQDENDKVQANNASTTITSWNNTQVSAKLASTPATGNQQFSLKLTRNDGVSVTIPASNCTVGVAQVSTGANLFCRSSNSGEVQNVEVVLIEDALGATPLPKEIVSISKTGIIQNLKAKLESGKNYKIGIKAPKSLRKVVLFKAVAGTTIIPDLALAIGDVDGNGQITAGDGIEVIRQWRLVPGGGVRTADFNGDGLVNSVDWVCYKHNAGQTEDPVPTPTILQPTTAPTPGP